MITTTHEQHEPGFARLADLIPATVTIARGGIRAVFSAGELEARLGLPGLGFRLMQFVAELDIHKSGDAGSGGKGGFKRLPLSQNANADKNSLNALALGVKEGTGEPSGDRATEPPVDNDEIERVAHHLAEALGGRAALINLPFYRLVVRTVSREIVRDALTRALDARDIRRSRAHLFAFLVREHLPSRHPNSISRAQPHI